MNPAIDDPRYLPADRLPDAQVSERIRSCLRERPDASPADVGAWLAQFDIRVAPHVIDALLAAMKSG